MHMAAVDVGNPAASSALFLIQGDHAIDSKAITFN